MTTRGFAKCLFWIAVLGYVPMQAKDAGGPCDEYISKSNCRVLIDMKDVRGPVTPQYRVAAPVHADVTVNSGATVTTILLRGSPFLSCSVAATPAAPTRDLSTAVAAGLTTVGTFAVPAVGTNLELIAPAPAPQIEALFNVAPSAAPEASPREKLALVNSQLSALLTLEGQAATALTDLYRQFQEALRLDWRYSFAPENPDTEAGLPLAQRMQLADGRANQAALDLSTRLLAILRAPVADLAALQAESKAMQDNFGKLYTSTDHTGLSDSDIETAGRAVTGAAGYADALQSATSDFKKKVKQYSDFVNTLKDSSGAFHASTTATLPMARYLQKMVTEKITCNDAVNTTQQPFDSITYTAYYENTPVFDISAGALMSFLPGRQVGPVAGPLSTMPATTGVTGPTGGSCGAFNPAETCLAITSSTKPQFMPAVFFELHPLQGKCPWATNGQQRHPFGYTCSLGFAAGLAINPNNGTGVGEGFEGISFGISRVVFLFGIHDGHYQTFTDGYYDTESVPAGTTAPTERKWTFHPAIGIAYRIVQR